MNTKAGSGSNIGSCPGLAAWRSGLYVLQMSTEDTLIAALHGDNSGSSNPNQKVVCLLNTFARPELRISIPCMLYISIPITERETKS